MWGGHAGTKSITIKGGPHRALPAHKHFPILKDTATSKSPPQVRVSGGRQELRVRVRVRVRRGLRV